MKFIRELLINPFSLWIRWTAIKFYFEHKYSAKNLAIGSMVRFTNCQFGDYNTLYNNVILTNVILGDFTYIAANSQLANIEIGKFSCIGSGVMAGFGKHPSRDFVSSHPAFYSRLLQAQITFA